MKIRNLKKLYIGLGLLVLFAIWTAAVCCVDVKAIGPNGSAVGFSVLNEFVHNLTGTNMLLYTVTDWLGLVPICFVLGFAVLGLIQLIKRKSILKVDYSILVLGGFYIVTIAAYLLFEMYPVNYRPVLIDGYLETSYPSSTTLLCMCVMPTAIMQLKERIKHKALRRTVTLIITLFTAFMVFSRAVSGVHWITDIIGGILLSGSLVMLYDFASKLIPKTE